MLCMDSKSCVILVTFFQHQPNPETIMNEKQAETTPESNDESPEMVRRQFLKKFGKYAVATPVVTYTLMSSATARPVGSDYVDMPG